MFIRLEYLTKEETQKDSFHSKHPKLYSVLTVFLLFHLGTVPVGGRGYYDVLQNIINLKMKPSAHTHTHKHILMYILALFCVCVRNATMHNNKRHNCVQFSGVLPICLLVYGETTDDAAAHFLFVVADVCF